MKQTQAIRAVRVTYGPVVQSMSPTSALVAWSTNVSSKTELHYGTGPSALDNVYSDLWPGLSHQAYLRNLTPGTTYYYRVVVPPAQDKGTQPMSGSARFTTPLAKSVGR